MWLLDNLRLRLWLILFLLDFTTASSSCDFTLNSTLILPPPQGRVPDTYTHIIQSTLSMDGALHLDSTHLRTCKLWIGRADCTTLLCIRDLNIMEFGIRRGSWNQSPRYQGTTIYLSLNLIQLLLLVVFPIMLLECTSFPLWNCPSLVESLLVKDESQLSLMRTVTTT